VGSRDMRSAWRRRHGSSRAGRRVVRELRYETMSRTRTRGRMNLDTDFPVGAGGCLDASGHSVENRSALETLRRCTRPSGEPACSRRSWIAFRALPPRRRSRSAWPHTPRPRSRTGSPNINGANEVRRCRPGPWGRGDYTVNTFSHVIKYNISFSGLSSSETLAHIHGPAAVGAKRSDHVSLPLGSPISGSFATTAASGRNLLGSLTYTNIHSSNFGGGEIRGQMVPSPAIGTNFCLGDGTGAACPCSNSGAPGHGCEKLLDDRRRAPPGTRATTAPTNVVLVATGEKPTATTIFLSGKREQAGPFIFGDGLRCVAGRSRWPRRRPPAGSRVPEGAELSITARSAQLEPRSVPEPSLLHDYYRDPDPAFCANPPGGTFKRSNAVDILW